MADPKLLSSAISHEDFDIFFYLDPFLNIYLFQSEKVIKKILIYQNLPKAGNLVI